jgi:hypothetical protein
MSPACAVVVIVLSINAVSFRSDWLIDRIMVYSAHDDSGDDDAAASSTSKEVDPDSGIHVINIAKNWVQVGLEEITVEMDTLYIVLKTRYLKKSL